MGHQPVGWLDLVRWDAGGWLIGGAILVANDHHFWQTPPNCPLAIKDGNGKPLVQRDFPCNTSIYFVDLLRR